MRPNDCCTGLEGWIKEFLIVTRESDNVHRDNRLRAGRDGFPHRFGINQQIVIHIHEDDFRTAMENHFGAGGIGVSGYNHLVALADTEPLQNQFQTSRGRIETHHVGYADIFRNLTLKLLSPGACSDPS